MNAHYSETYLSVRQLGGHSKPRKKLTERERELEAERYLNMKISHWMNQTTSVISEERYQQWINA